MENSFLWREPEKVCPAQNELAFIVLRLYGFSTNFFQWLLRKKGYNMVDNSAGSIISSATGIFLFLLHTKVGREQLVYVQRRLDTVRNAAWVNNRMLFSSRELSWRSDLWPGDRSHA